MDPDFIESVMFAPINTDDDNVPFVTLDDIVSDMDVEIAESDDYILDGE